MLLVTERARARAELVPRTPSAKNASADNRCWRDPYVRLVGRLHLVYPECYRPFHFEVPGDRRGRTGEVRGRGRRRDSYRQHEPRVLVERNILQQLDTTRRRGLG